MGKYNFGFDVSALSDFVNENTGLVAEAIYDAPTLKSGVDIIPGQKGDFKLNVVDNDLYLQNAACGWTNSGKTTFSQIRITLDDLMIKTNLCPRDLEPKWYGQLMKAGSTPEDFPFSQFVLEKQATKLTAEVEYLFWQAEKGGSGTGNLPLTDGIAPYLHSVGGSVYVATASGTSTASNINDKIEDMIAQVDEKAYVNDDLTLYMSVADFKIYVQYLINANLYNYAKNENGKSLETTIPGHNIKVIGVSGLRGTHYWYLTPASNLIFGTDLLNETETLDMWYSKDNDEIRIRGEFKMGVGAWFPEFVVHNNPNI